MHLSSTITNSADYLRRRANSRTLHLNNGYEFYCHPIAGVMSDVLMVTCKDGENVKTPVMGRIHHRRRAGETAGPRSRESRTAT